MEGHGGDGYRGFFSQPDPLSPSGGFDVYSQPEFSMAGGSGGRAPRTRIEAVDLNSQADDFPHLSAFQELLQPGHPEQAGGGGGEGLAPIRVRGGRGRGTANNPFRAPRAGGEGRGRGGRRGGRVGGAHARSMSTGGGTADVLGGFPAWGAAASRGGREGSPAWGAAGGGGRGGRGSRRASCSADPAEAAAADNFHSAPGFGEEEEGDDTFDEQMMGAASSSVQHPSREHAGIVAALLAHQSNNRKFIIIAMMIMIGAYYFDSHMEEM